MSEDPVPCLHCAIIEIINNHVFANGLLDNDPASKERYEAFSGITANLILVLEDHLDGIKTEKLQVEAWRQVVMWALTEFLSLTSASEVAEMFMKATAEAADESVKH
jgi:hypothetical protein